MTASGVAIATSPQPYRLDYRLNTRDDFVTADLHVTALGEDLRRELHLIRDADGGWTANGLSLEGLAGSLDCDLAWSPLTNSMPVLRHGLLNGGGPLEFTMAWVSVPDLSVQPSGQRYTFLRRSGGRSFVHYESESRDFVAELIFYADGVVVDYTGIGRAGRR